MRLLWKLITFFFSGHPLEGGGYLSIEDVQGLATKTFLKDGFFDYLNKVLEEYFLISSDIEGFWSCCLYPVR